MSRHFLMATKSLSAVPLVGAGGAAGAAGRNSRIVLIFSIVPKARSRLKDDSLA
jgi:hypothetical protein